MLWREGWRVLTLGSTILLRKKRLNKKPILLTEGLLFKKFGVGSFWGRFGGMCSTMVSCMKTRTGSMCSGTRQHDGKARCQRHPDASWGLWMLRSQGDRRFYTEVKEGADIHLLLCVGERGEGGWWYPRTYYDLTWNLEHFFGIYKIQVYSVKYEYRRQV